jgi:hypothetical protein
MQNELIKRLQTTFACDCGAHLHFKFAACFQLTIARAQASLCLPSNVLNLLGRALSAALDHFALSSRMPIGPGGLNEQSTNMSIVSATTVSAYLA